MSVAELIAKMRDYCKNNKLQCIVIAVVEILAFGFLATHYFYHLDMLLVDEYYNGTVLIGAGRFSAPLINYFSNWMQFAPFWHTALMAIILFLSGLVFGVLFKQVSADKLSDSAVFIFWLMFVSCPIICHQTTYPVLSVVLPYLLIGVACWLILPLFSAENVKLLRLVGAVLLLVLSVDMYESHASVILTVCFSLMFIKYWFNKGKNDKLLHLINITVKICLILITAIILDFIISKVVCYFACGTFEFWYQTNTSVAWTNGASLFTNVKWLIRELIGQYVIAGISNYCVFMYDLSIICGCITALIISIRKRNLLIFILYIAICVSSMALAVVIGSAPEYRMAQAVPVIVALFFMVLVCVIPKKTLIKGIVYGIIGIIVFNQTLYINRYSVLNYERYEYENNILQNISQELMTYPVETKPVLFLYGNEDTFPEFEATPLDLNNPIAKVHEKIMSAVFDKIIPGTTYKRLNERYGYRVDYELCDASSVAEFFNKDYKILPYISFNQSSKAPTNTIAKYRPEVYKAFDKLGLNLIVDESAIANNREIYDSLTTEYINSPAYPYPGYIVETDERIIVKIYK